MINNLSISPHNPTISLKSVTSPIAPNQINITRQFKNRLDYIVEDEVASNDATILPPVSVFDGVDGFVGGVSYAFSREDTISFNFTSSDIIGSQTLFGDLVSQIRIRNSDFIVVDEFDNVRVVPISITILDGVNYNVSIYRDGVDFVINIDGANVATFTDDIGNINILNIGSARGALFEGYIFEINLNNELIIPLPHLAIGFDQNNDPVTLTVSGGVTEGYSEQGSLYMQDNGAVARNPELVENGDFSYDGEWIKTSGITISNRSVKFDTSINVNCGIQQTLPRGKGLSLIIEYDIISNSIPDGNLNLYTGSLVNPTLAIPSEIGQNTVQFTANGDNDLLYIRWLGVSAGTLELTNVSVRLATPDYIPNKPNGQPAYTLVDGDTFISGSLGRMNGTPCRVRLYELGDVDAAKTFFDKSNALIWKQTVRDSVYYDSLNTGDWHNSELTQQYIYDNIQDAYKYQLWSKIQSGVFKDIFLYGAPLTEPDISKAIKYVGVEE